MRRKGLEEKYGVEIVKNLSKYCEVYNIKGVKKDFETVREVEQYLDKNYTPIVKSTVGCDYYKQKKKLLQKKKRNLMRFYDVAIKHMQPYYISHSFDCPICLSQAIVYSDNMKIWAKCSKCKAEIHTSLEEVENEK